ncbi:MAG: hypothetical protein U0793_07575 [Gemmataceae bacterium]
MAAHDVQAVELRFLDGDKGGVTKDPVAIAKIVEVLKWARETASHKCMWHGKIFVRCRDGREVELRFLPGHEPDWYEFRFEGKTYRVDRASFLEAMGAMGVEMPLSC